MCRMARTADVLHHVVHSLHGMYGILHAFGFANPGGGGGGWGPYVGWRCAAQALKPQPHFRPENPIFRQDKT